MRFCLLLKLWAKILVKTSPYNSYKHIQMKSKAKAIVVITERAHFFYDNMAIYTYIYIYIYIAEMKRDTEQTMKLE